MHLDCAFIIIYFLQYWRFPMLFILFRQMYSSGFCGQYHQQYLNQKEVYSQLLRHRMVAKKSPVVSGEDLTSPRSSVSSRSDSSFLSPASTPEIKSLRQKREKMVKQASIKWLVLPSTSGGNCKT